MVYDKATLKCCGIYAIVNLHTCRTYVGLTRDSFRSRWWLHTGELRRGTHPCTPLQVDWNVLGQDGFDFRILELIPRTYYSDIFKAREWHHMQQAQQPLYNVQMPGVRVRATNDVDDIISRVQALVDSSPHAAGAAGEG